MNEFGILHLKDEKFNPSLSRETQLLIKIAPRRISYAIINEKESRLQVLYDSPISVDAESTLMDLFAEHDYLRWGFGVVKISVQTDNFTLIPIQYYTRDDISSYEKLIQSSTQTKTFVSTINAESIKSVSALPLETITPFTSSFPDVRLFCQAEPLVEGALKIDSLKRNKLVLQFNEESFEIYLSSDQKLIFYNIFSMCNADDFNYFLLNVMQQFAIDPLDTSVYVSGMIASGDANYRRVQKYFKVVDFADSSQFAAFSGAFEQLPKHQHFSLLSLLLCE